MNSLDWIPALFEIFLRLQKLLRQNSHEGIFEMLEYESTLELLDSNGEKAILKKRQRVKFLQDNVIAFQDHAWGDGNVIAKYECSPGIVVDRYRDGDRWNMLISLRETKAAGSVEDFYIQRNLLRGFMRRDEWWQIEMHHETKWLKISIVFPKHRHCRHAVVLEKTKNRTQLLGSEFLRKCPDGRQVLTWEKKNPMRFETYTIKWHW